MEDYYVVVTLNVNGKQTTSKRMTYSEALKYKEKKLRVKVNTYVSIKRLYAQRWKDRRRQYERSLRND